MSEKVTIFDTTLRDGEQAAGVCFSARDKVEIASRLAAMGVDVIEAGFPGASSAEALAVAAVAREVRDAAICGLARAVPSDVAATPLRNRIVCRITSGSFIMKVWVTGRTMWSLRPGRRVEATETLPSSGPSIRNE